MVWRACNFWGFVIGEFLAPGDGTYFQAFAFAFEQFGTEVAYVSEQQID